MDRDKHQEYQTAHEVCRIMADDFEAKAREVRERRMAWLRDEIKSWQYRDTTDMNQLRQHREHVAELKELEANDGTR